MIGSTVFGLGLRSPHLNEILARRPKIDFFEAISENYMGMGRHLRGRSLENLLAIRSHYSIVLHGVSLSIGSTDPLNKAYLKRLKHLIEMAEPLWVSDHLCWTGVSGENLHDLFPLPYTKKAIRHVSDRILRVQDFLKQRILIENVSSYISFKHSEMSEWDFINQICERADCHVLLDINNIFVSSFNHGFNGRKFLRAIPVHRVKQFHLAGHLDKGDFKIDTHGEPICDSVWGLYEEAVGILGHVPVIIERDSNIPPLRVLMKELSHAKRIAHAKGNSEMDALDRHRPTGSQRSTGRSESAPIS